VRPTAGTNRVQPGAAPQRVNLNVVYVVRLLWPHIAASGIPAAAQEKAGAMKIRRPAVARGERLKTARRNWDGHHGGRRQVPARDRRGADDGDGSAIMHVLGKDSPYEM